MSELIDWLKAQLDEDKALARATEGAWIPLGPDPNDRRPIARLMSLHNPALVLADLEAKRAILDLHQGDFPYDPDDGPGSYSWTERCQHDGQESPCSTVRLLGSAYRHRPGYQEAWRP